MPINHKNHARKDIKIGTKLINNDGKTIVTIEKIEVVKRRGKLQTLYIAKQGHIYSENLENWNVVK